MWLSVVFVFGCEIVKVDNRNIKGGKGKQTLI